MRLAILSFCSSVSTSSSSSRESGRWDTGLRDAATYSSSGTALCIDSSRETTNVRDLPVVLDTRMLSGIDTLPARQVPKSSSGGSMPKLGTLRTLALSTIAWSLSGSATLATRRRSWNAPESDGEKVKSTPRVAWPGTTPYRPSASRMSPLAMLPLLRMQYRRAHSLRFWIQSLRSRRSPVSIWPKLMCGCPSSSMLRHTFDRTIRSRTGSSSTSRPWSISNSGACAMRDASNSSRRRKMRESCFRAVPWMCGRVLPFGVYTATTGTSACGGTSSMPIGTRRPASMDSCSARRRLISVRTNRSSASRLRVGTVASELGCASSAASSASRSSRATSSASESTGCVRRRPVSAGGVLPVVVSAVGGAGAEGGGAGGAALACGPGGPCLPSVRSAP